MLKKFITLNLKWVETAFYAGTALGLAVGTLAGATVGVLIGSGLALHEAVGKAGKSAEIASEGESFKDDMSPSGKMTSIHKNGSATARKTTGSRNRKQSRTSNG